MFTRQPAKQASSNFRSTPSESRTFSNWGSLPHFEMTSVSVAMTRRSWARRVSDPGHTAKRILEPLRIERGFLRAYHSACRTLSERMCSGTPPGSISQRAWRRHPRISSPGRCEPSSIPAELIDAVQHPIFLVVESAIRDKIIGPDMTEPLLTSGRCERPVRGPGAPDAQRFCSACHFLTTAKVFSMCFSALESE